jgi:diketogulonate reductase-like aldo/keto reductase
MEHVTVAGTKVPSLGLGTYKLRGRECTEVVETAIELGYRHIDTAEFYNNQAAIGDAIAAASVPREELFVTTKVWKTNLHHEQVLASATESIEKLDLEQVDLLLIHWPNERVPIEETIRAMNELQDRGLVRHIGVSNFSVSQLRAAREASKTPIIADQVPYDPTTDQRDLLEFCIDEEVLLTAYSPLAKGRVESDETLAEIGDRHGKSPPQVALRWLVQQPMVAAIPKASTRAHLAANIDIFDFELTDAEMERVFEHQGGLVSRLRNVLGL